MKRRQKTGLIWLLCAVMVLSLFPSFAFAEEGEDETPEHAEEYLIETGEAMLSYAEEEEDVPTEEPEEADQNPEEELQNEEAASGTEPEEEDPGEENDADTDAGDSADSDSEDFNNEDAEEPNIEDADIPNGEDAEDPDTGDSENMDSDDGDAQDPDLEDTDDLNGEDEDEPQPADPPDGEGETESEEENKESLPADGELLPEDQPQEETEDELWERDEEPSDNEALLKNYAQMRLDRAAGKMMLRASSYAGRKLYASNPMQFSVYSLLKDGAIEIAAGNRSSTVFSGSISDLTAYGEPTKTLFSAEDLGLETINSANRSKAENKVKELLGVSGGISPAIYALLADCPYELYWFDKTSGWSSSFTIPMVQVDGVTYMEVQRYTFKLSAAPAYAGEDAYTVSGTDAALIDTAIENAREIVENASLYSDRGKLDDYRVQICDLVSYNNDAAGSVDTPYGDPWQIIWVFDGDNSTNVVCEGYAKAFQYLCELSSFEEAVNCYSVSGFMNGGNHMWNIVSFHGSNYLADLTNCDLGSVGWPTRLFMTGFDSGSVSQGYTFSVGARSIRYSYNSSTTTAFDEASLTLVAKSEQTEPVDSSITVLLTSQGSSGESVGLLTGGGTYAPGDVITITASEVEGYTFLGWYQSNGNCVSTNYTFSFTTQNSIYLIARYESLGTMVTLTVRGADISVNGQTQSGGTYSGRYICGSTVTLVWNGNAGSFLRWRNESDMTESTNPAFSFALVRSVTLTADILETDGGSSQDGYSAYVEFLSDDGQVILAGRWNSLDSAASHPLPVGPSRTGKIFEGWTLNGEILADAGPILAAIGEDTAYLQVVPRYSSDTVRCTVNVLFDDSLRSWSIRKGFTFTVTAPEIAGKIFDHWEDENGTLLGTQETYRQLIAGNRTLHAVYVSESSVHDPQPVLAVTGVDAVSAGNVHKIAFRVTRDLPEGYTLNRLTMLVSTDASCGEENAEQLMLVDSGFPQAESTLTGPTGTLTVNKKVTDDNAFVYARGYMLVTDAAGERQEIYTPIVSASYAELVS